MSYHYGNYGGYGNPYDRYQVPAAAPQAQPECKLTLVQLFANAELRQDVVRTLGGGGSGISARWWKVAVELSQLSPYARQKINMTFIQDIESAHNTGPKRADFFLEELLGLKEITGQMFIQACRNALLERLADELCKASV